MASGSAVGKDLGSGRVSRAAESQTTRRGLAEGAGQVFARRQVHRRLAPHGTVDGCQQGGGQLHQGDPPQVDRRRQNRLRPPPRRRPGPPPGRPACQVLLGQKIQDLGQHGQAFGAFARRDDHAARGKARRFPGNCIPDRRRACPPFSSVITATRHRAVDLGDEPAGIWPAAPAR